MITVKIMPPVIIKLLRQFVSPIVSFMSLSHCDGLQPRFPVQVLV
jgi:hypothetical protein